MRLTAIATAAIATISGLLLAAGPAPAQAGGVVVPPAGKCPDDGAAQVFARWWDRSPYVLVGDGGFENGAEGWTLSPGATVVAGNEPWKVRSPDDSRALALEPRAHATSPPVCVGLGHPTARFFARNTGSPLGLLVVQVVFRTSVGSLALPVGVVLNPSRSWSPTLPMPVLANLLTLLDGSTTVAFRFTAVGPHSSWQIDDVYVDPWRK
jgi:hypothetical protein